MNTYVCAVCGKETAPIDGKGWIVYPLGDEKANQFICSDRCVADYYLKK